MKFQFYTKNISVILRRDRSAKEPGELFGDGKTKTGIAFGAGYIRGVELVKNRTGIDLLDMELIFKA